MNHIRRGPRWWTLEVPLMATMVLALLAHFVEMPDDDLRLVGITIAVLVFGVLGVWVWRNRRNFP